MRKLTEEIRKEPNNFEKQTEEVFSAHFLKLKKKGNGQKLNFRSNSFSTPFLLVGFRLSLFLFRPLSIASFTRTYRLMIYKLALKRPEKMWKRAEKLRKHVEKCGNGQKKCGNRQKKRRKGQNKCGNE